MINQPSDDRLEIVPLWHLKAEFDKRFDQQQDKQFKLRYFSDTRWKLIAALGEYTMRKYYKAYKLGDLRQFSHWAECIQTNREELPDDTICYLSDDFTVAQSPFSNADPLFKTVTPEWQEFCKNHLKFEIPEDLRYAYEEPAS
jgi:hypothetical protein